MRFIVMHKLDDVLEAGGPPDQKIIAGMGELVQESLKKGVMLNGAGLHPSARRARVKCKGGQCTVSRGPYEGENELVASVTMISTRSMDDALAHAETLGKLIGDAEIEVGPVVETWDLGLTEKPKGQIPERFLFLCKSTAALEADAEASKQHRAAVKELGKSLGDKGVVLAVETLAPSSLGARLPAGRGKRTWVDGPFAESKELISGFSLIALPSKAEALAWADRYAAILGPTNEVDVRQVHEPA